MKKTRAGKLKNIVGSRVRAARSRSRPPVSQNDLCARLKTQLGVQMNQASLSKLENGERYVLDYEIAAIAKALRMKVGTFFGE